MAADRPAPTPPPRAVPDDPERDWTAPGVYEVRPGLYRIPLPLPQDGLRAVNVYAVRDGDAIVLVDSGWAVPAAHDQLRRALRALDAGEDRISRILVTHVHRDHYNLAVRLRRGNPHIRVGLGRGEQPALRVAQGPVTEPWGVLADQLRREGAPGLAKELVTSVPVDHDPADWADPDVWIDAPRDIALRTATWRAYPTPGHTRGHVVFDDAARGVMFCGDHVLPHITPSIGFEPCPAVSPLRDYLHSLRLVRDLPDRMMLPAHGPTGPSVHARVDELVRHHDVRLRQSAEAVAAGAVTAYEVARLLRWTRRERHFDDLDVMSRCLAVTETAAHLDVLAGTGQLRATAHDGVRAFEAV
ncbi:MBL fold metallo-hydrolase [Phytohabitans houttuyneae]|uniref:MBL fold metallo-hydrolase n=1 Tax=Phytohabitans houttuyneae TaxID=1076126 RepID=A0A6V8KKX5_9ACTN|nr:MBL fold metallo-hydrolase [Phytohabitans houttuyneae]GFJ82407.1 MBL fold metallo-hydrolase [Phytohabitans houttuyneae]